NANIHRTRAERGGRAENSNPIAAFSFRQANGTAVGADRRGPDPKTKQSENENPKSETRNSKSEIRNKTEDQNQKRRQTSLRFIRIWTFEFVSDFVLRISDFNVAHVYPAVKKAPRICMGCRTIQTPTANRKPISSAQ